MAKVTFGTKVDRIMQTGARINLVVADDINQMVNSINALYDALDSVVVVSNVLFGPTDMPGGHYQNNLLINLEPDADFIVFTDNGSGVVISLTDEYDPAGGYLYAPDTGTVTMPVDGVSKYRILIMRPLIVD